MLVKRPLEGTDVVPRHNERVGKLVRRLASAGGQRRDRVVGMRPVAHQHVVEPSVIVAFKLHEQRPACKRPSQPKGGLYGFRTGVRKNDAFNPRQKACHEFRQFNLASVLGAKSKCFGELFSDGGHHCRMSISENKRPPCERVVEEPVAVYIEVIGALASLKKERRRRACPSHTAGHAHGQRPLGSSQ